jgi:transcriptional regulator with XRE-family HTH domain
MNDLFSLGKRLRVLRTERDLSQRDLARLAGVSTNSVSLIERDQISPSVSTLQNLASALNVKVSFFFDDEVQQDVLLVKAAQRPSISVNGVVIQGIGKRLRLQEVEPFHIILEPHALSGERQVIHPGHELVFCMTGKVEYLIDGKTYELGKGDFLVFEAMLPHIWRNPYDEKAEFLLVLQTPNDSRDPVQRHFADYPSITHIGH